MAGREEEPKAGRPEKQGPTPRPASGRGQGGKDPVLRALAEVEETLARLKQVRAERAQAEAAFKAELAQREQLQQQLTAQRDDAQAALEDALRRIAVLEQEREHNLALEASRLEALTHERDGAAAERDDLTRRLNDLESELHRERDARAALEQALAAAEADRTELARVQAAESELRANLEQLQERVATLAARAEEAGSEADRRQAEAADAAREAATLRDRVHALEADLTTARDGMSGDLQRLSADAEHHAARSRDLEAELACARAELDVARDESDHRRAEIDRLADELSRLRHEIDQATAEAADQREQAAESARNAEILATKLGEQDARIAALGAALDDARANAGAGEARDTIAAMGAELEQARAEARDLRDELEAALAASAEAEAAAKAAADRHTEALGAARENLEAQLADAQRQLEELRLSGDADLSLAAELESLRAGLAEATSQRDESRTRAETAVSAAQAAQAELDDLRAKLDLAADRLLELQALAEAYESGAVETTPDGSPLAPHLAMRRSRLRRVRGLLREQKREMARASGILAERVKMCDELLARRRELAEAREIIERTHRKVVGGRARSSAAAVVFFGSSLLAVLAGASWVTVSHFYPATYAASAVLAADFRGVTPTPEAIESWEAFHQQMIFDPQLLGRVSERMKQRGFEDLSVPAVVKTRLEQDLTWNAPEPGRIAFELRGVGREATARVLDTFVTTLEVESNALRQRRDDSAQTVVTEHARAGVEPILDERPAYAAIGLAGAASVASILWFGIWRRMVKTKHAFESAGHIDHLLEEARWVDPIEQITNPRVERRKSPGRAA